MWALILVLASVLASLTLGAGTTPKEVEPSFAGARALIDEKIADGSVPSVCVAVARGGEVVWEVAFGWADAERGARATTHTSYLLASVSKPMTATAVMTLVERGRIDLDTPLQQYMDDVPLSSPGGYADDVTVRHVLNHTSGLPLHFNYFYADEDRVRPSIEETIRRYGVLIEAPGRTFRYANLGYGVLGHVVASVSERDFADYVRDEVFIPLGMNDARVGSPPELHGVAVRYDDEGTVLPWVEVDTPGAAMFYGSAHDLIRFGMFHLKDHLGDQTAVLSDRSLDAMHWSSDPGAAYDTDLYGLGWFFNEDDSGCRVLWHEGGMSGTRTMLKLLPDHDIAVAIVMNIFDGDTCNAIADSILGELVPDYAEMRAKGECGPSNKFTSYEPSDEFTGIWRGSIHTHEGEVPVYMAFQSDGDIHVLTEPYFETSQALPGQDLWDVVLNNVGVMGNRIYGWANIAIPTSDTSPYPYVVVIDVVRRGRTLSGSVTAVATADRMYYALSSYASLEKD